MQSLGDDDVSLEWMPLYWDKLLSDTTDLSAEEIGVYILLLGYQWTKGSIPAALPAMARIARVKAPLMREILSILGERLQPVDGNPDALSSPFMEQVRETQIARFRKRSNAGKRGAAKRWKDDYANGNASNNANAGALESHSDRNPTAVRPDCHIENIDRSPSAREGVGARDDSNANGNAITTDADALADYLLDIASEHGFEMGHFALDPASWRHKNRADGVKLIAAYGLELCKTRAVALVVAMQSGKITSRRISTTLLFQAWNYRELADVLTPAKTGPSFDDMMAGQGAA